MRDALFGEGAYEKTPAVEGLGGVSGGFPAEGVGGGVNKYCDSIVNIIYSQYWMNKILRIYIIFI